MSFLRKFLSVEMLLRDMLYVSYFIPSARISPFLPPALKPATVGGNNVFVTLVIFRGKTSGVATIPTPRIPFNQVNIRTYVIDPVSGKPSVYFVHCGISGGLITFLYRILSGMPVQHTSFRIDPVKGNEADYSHYKVSGKWNGKFIVEAKEVSPALITLSPFLNVREAIDYLIDPLVGFYTDGGILRRLEVYHDPLVPRVFTPSKILFPYLSKLDIVPEEEITQPHNVLLVPFTSFFIYLPARAYAQWSVAENSRKHLSGFFLEFAIKLRGN
ncbi:DUF2071 domain-containing protein [Syntrophorhabdus aromaticivorans]|uniref:DUF2071 domain-containing protein n=1 Tax=Syntrophorhabdus aromaticivorans TaxID=328301 RepID=UPI0018DCE310|nr:DUF2071 domain-containing protein [Syntrophorhabdus aromaticivorans]